MISTSDPKMKFVKDQSQEEEVSSTCSESSSTQMMDLPLAPIVSAEEWFTKGQRVPFDPAKKRILDKPNSRSVNVWKRVVAPFALCHTTRWLTFLPGPPDGTFSFSKVDDSLNTAPRLYLEFVGLGDSDKPNDYAHSVMERANLVEAHWRAEKVRRTVLVCQSCSSMVMMELLNRQQERLSLGLPLRTRIEHVLCFNGAYFSHTHTPHPLNSSQFINNTVGKVAVRAAQRSDTVLETIIRKCFSKEYKVSKQEVREIGAAVRRHKGMNYFTSKATRYIEEHKTNANRWDLVNVYKMTRKLGITFKIVGSEQDKFEFKSFHLARELLDRKDGIQFETFTGGYYVCWENPHRVAGLIDGAAMSPAFDESTMAHWTGATAPCSLGSGSGHYPAQDAWLASKRSSMGNASSYSDGNSTASTSYLSSLEPSASSGWADAEFPEEYEYAL